MGDFENIIKSSYSRVKDNKCITSQKSFHNSSTLKKHEQTHTSIKDYKHISQADFLMKHQLSMYYRHHRHWKSLEVDCLLDKFFPNFLKSICFGDDFFGQFRG